MDLARKTVGQFSDAKLVEIHEGRLLVYEGKPAEVARAVIDVLG